jgi:nucleoid-associated protein
MRCSSSLDPEAKPRKVHVHHPATLILAPQNQFFATKTLVDYASSQAKLGEPMGLEELSELIDEERPKAFYDHIRNKDYGLSPEIPADKRTLNQFRRFTGRAEGLSISFEAHLLGSKIEYDEEAGTLIIKGLPTSLTDQLKRRN